MILRTSDTWSHPIWDFHVLYSLRPILLPSLSWFLGLLTPGPIPFGTFMCSTHWDQYFYQAFRDSWNFAIRNSGYLVPSHFRLSCALLIETNTKLVVILETSKFEHPSVLSRFYFSHISRLGSRRYPIVTSMCRHICNWNIVVCDVKQPIHLTDIQSLKS